MNIVETPHEADEPQSHLSASHEQPAIAELATATAELQQVRAELAQLHAEQQEFSQLAALSNAVAATLSQTGDLPSVLQHCLDHIAQYIAHLASARVWTFSAETNLLELQAIAGSSTSADPFPHRIPAGISIIGFIAQNRTPYLTNSVATDAVIGAQDWVRQEKIVAFAGYPLIVEGQLVGVLALFNRQPLSALVQTALATLATQLAIAIDRIWARDELIVGREALLFRLANQIRKSLDLDTILGNAVQEIRGLLQIDACHVLWYVPQFTQPVLSITHEAKAPERSSLIGEYPVDQVTALYEQVLSLQMIRTNDVAADATLEMPVGQLLQQFGITAQLMLPMETRSGQIGAIMCSQWSSARIWTDSEVELLQAVVDQLALAIDQAELYSQSRSAAIAAQTQAQKLSEALNTLKQAQSQLIQSEKMSSLGQMVAGIAHEINNPVNFITGNLSHASTYVQDLLKLIELYRDRTAENSAEIQAWEETIDLDFITEDLPNLFSSMKIGADRIRQIVLSLRNFSRLDEAEMKPVNIHEGIDNTLMILQNRLKALPSRASIQVLKLYGNLPAVDCYAGQLNQVFMNVLSNAIDALEDSRCPDEHLELLSPTQEALAACQLPTITIQTEQLDADWVMIRIRDNGPGMTDAVRLHLFDPFFTTKPVGKGTGLGLSISYQIVVERHQGKFECFSEPGQGAEFCIQIPINARYRGSRQEPAREEGDSAFGESMSDLI